MAPLKLHFFTKYNADNHTYLILFTILFYLLRAASRGTKSSALVLLCTAKRALNVDATCSPIGP